MSEPVIELCDVHFAYESGRVVFDALNFTIQSGDRVGLTGANGSGKTSLLHLIVGLVAPSSGEVRCFGTPRRGDADFHEVRRRVGLLFQDSDDQLFCPTVGEDIAFGPLNLGVSEREASARVRASLDAVGLAGYEERITYKLSGGEKRLVAIATVLAMEPDVLLLDEPLTGLDEAHEQRVTEVLKSLSQTMLVVSHDRAFLSQVTSRQIKLANGALSEN